MSSKNTTSGPATLCFKLTNKDTFDDQVSAVLGDLSKVLSEMLNKTEVTHDKTELTVGGQKYVFQNHDEEKGTPLKPDELAMLCQVAIAVIRNVHDERVTVVQPPESGGPIRICLKDADLVTGDSPLWRSDMFESNKTAAKNPYFQLRRRVGTDTDTTNYTDYQRNESVALLTTDKQHPLYVKYVEVSDTDHSVSEMKVTLTQTEKSSKVFENKGINENPEAQRCVGQVLHIWYHLRAVMQAHKGKPDEDEVYEACVNVLQEVHREGGVFFPKVPKKT